MWLPGLSMSIEYGNRSYEPPECIAMLLDMRKLYTQLDRMCSELPTWKKGTLSPVLFLSTLQSKN
jgi:hypothetical protein